MIECWELRRFPRVIIGNWIWWTKDTMAAVQNLGLQGKLPRNDHAPFSLNHIFNIAHIFLLSRKSVILINFFFFLFDKIIYLKLK